VAQRHHLFSIVSPKDNPPVNSTLERTDFPPGVVQRFRIRIPSGHHDLTGIRIIYGDSQIIPRVEDTWLHGDHISPSFLLDDPYPGGQGWFVEHYNADHFYDHTFHVEVWLDAVSTSDDLLPPVIWLRGTSGGGAVAGAGGTPTPIPGVSGAS
jgi:hypothetical protein